MAEAFRQFFKYTQYCETNKNGFLTEKLRSTGPINNLPDLRSPVQIQYYQQPIASFNRATRLYTT